MEEKDFIKDLFQEKLSNFETPVRPELWSAVSSSIGAGGTTAATGFSMLTKWIVGLTIAAGSAGTLWYVFSDSKNSHAVEKTVPNTIPQRDSKDKNYEKSIENKLNFDQTQKNTLVVTSEEAENPEFKEEKNISISDINQVELIQEKSLVENNAQKVVATSVSETKPVVKTKKSEEEPKNDSKKNQPEESKLNVAMPNVFTPNNDGSNDYLSIPDLDVEDFSLVVLDEKGKTIYTTTSIDFQWDGIMLNGELAPSGNYVYFFTAKDRKGKAVTKYSPLNIRY